MEQKPDKDLLTEKESAKAQVARNYKWLSFFSRIALICNLCFLCMMFVHYTYDFLAGLHGIESTVVVLGVLSFIVNIILQACLFIFRAVKKDISIKPWLRIFNVAMFALQIIYYFIIPGK